MVSRRSLPLVSASTLSLTPACDRGRDDLPTRFAGFTPTCAAAEPYTPTPPVKIGRFEIPLSDADIRDTVTCTGPDARLVISHDERGRTRALEFTLAAAPPDAARPQITALFTGLVPAEAVQHINDDLTSFLPDWTPFGDLSAASFYQPAVGQPREVVVQIQWR